MIKRWAPVLMIKCHILSVRFQVSGVRWIAYEHIKPNYSETIQHGDEKWLQQPVYALFSIWNIYFNSAHWAVMTTKILFRLFIQGERSFLFSLRHLHGFLCGCPSLYGNLREVFIQADFLSSLFARSSIFK